MSPVAAEATCCVAPADRANLAASFDGGCTPVELRASEFVSADPASQAADANASDAPTGDSLAPTGDSLLESAPLGIPDPNGNTFVSSQDAEGASDAPTGGTHCSKAPRPRSILPSPFTSGAGARTSRTCSMCRSMRRGRRSLRRDTTVPPCRITPRPRRPRPEHPREA